MNLVQILSRQIECLVLAGGMIALSSCKESVDHRIASHGETMPLLFPLVFVGMWLAISYILSRFGWIRFSRRYPCRTRPIGTSYPAPGLSFGLLGPSYRNVARAIPTAEGIYFYNFILFRMFHPAFLLPWSSIVRVEKRDGWFTRGYLLRIEDPAGSFRVLLRSSIEIELNRYVPQLLETSP